MGIVRNLGGRAGGALGSYAGGKIGSRIGGKTGSKIGKKIGSYAGTKLGEYAASKIPVLGSLKKGGIIRKTGLYKLHKGERVIPARRHRKKRS